MQISDVIKQVTVISLMTKYKQPQLLPDAVNCHCISNWTFMSIARCQIGFGLHQSYLQLSTILQGEDTVTGCGGHPCMWWGLQRMVVTLKRQQDKKREHVFYISGRNSGARRFNERWWGKLLRTQAAEIWKFGCGFGMVWEFPNSLQGFPMLFLNFWLAAAFDMGLAMIFYKFRHWIAVTGTLRHAATDNWPTLTKKGLDIEEVKVPRTDRAPETPATKTFWCTNWVLWCLRAEWQIQIKPRELIIPIVASAEQSTANYSTFAGSR